MNDLLTRLDKASVIVFLTAEEGPASEMASLFKQASARIRELEAIVEKLPMTKDRVRVTPGDHIFVVHSEHDISEVSVGDYEKRTVTSRPDSCYQRTWHCYSTREAAEKAREA